jgi:CheY-like chemotaxis protein
MMTILVIDDNKDYRRTLIELLILENYQTLEAIDGLAGIEMIRKHSPDLIISDLEMPVMNGLQLLKLVKSHPILGKTPFIMITGYSDQAFVSSLSDLGLAACFLKPVGITELLGAIEKCLSADSAS